MIAALPGLFSYLFWRVNAHTLNEAISIHPSFQVDFDHMVDRNLMIYGKNMRFPNR